MKSVPSPRRVRTGGMRLHSILSCLALACASCANMRITNTGFLADHDQLAPDETKDVAWIPDEVRYFERPDADWARYTKVLIEPVVYRRTEVEPHTELTSAEVGSLTARFHEILTDRLGDRFEVRDHADDETLVVRAAITDVDHSLVWLNVLGVILVVPPDMGGISGELEVLDGATRERLVAMAAHRDGTPFLLFECFSRFGHAKHGMKKWAKLLLRAVEP